MNKNKEKIVIFSLLLISVLSFFSFGFFHLGKFETTDEHLWKYDRIGNYWQALSDKNWEKTYINDKPGVTVALISGIGLLSEPRPENNENVSGATSENKKLFEQYNYQQSELTNFRFRLPILIFSTLSLLAFFWLSYRAFKSYWTALLTTILIATNPILLGISQIINPDSFFWIFGGLSVLSYLAYLNTAQRKFLILCGILTGFALLSKYTAFILFVFFILATLGKIVFQKEENALRVTWQTILKYIGEIALIFLISIVVFAIFLPAVFIKPEYLFKGIFQFMNFKMILGAIVLVAASAVIIAYKKDTIGQIISRIARYKNIILAISLSLFSILLIISIINVWTGQKFSPVNQLSDLAYVNEPKEFNFKPLLNLKENSAINFFKLYLMEAYPFIFSISPLILFLTLLITLKSIRGKIRGVNNYILFAIPLFILVYIFSTIIAHIVTNTRYFIILYPLLAIFSALAIVELLKLFKLQKTKHILIISTFLILWGIFSLWIIRPFYFSYTNSILPSQYNIHDSWGHGSYETAQYLNNMPNAKDLVIWSNSDTVCRFFMGKCLRSRRIDLNKVTPDYFVISKRGALKTKNHFMLLNNPNPQKDGEFYFNNLDTDYDWKIIINNRPENYIKVVKFEN